MRIILPFAVAIACCGPAWAQAQMPGIREAVEPLLPGLTVRVVRETPRDLDGSGDRCGGNTPTIWECPGSPPFPASWGIGGNFTIGFDSAGNGYHVAIQNVSFPEGTANLLRRVSPSGVVEDVAQLYRSRAVAGWSMSYDPQGAILDVTNGRIWLLVMAWFVDPGGRRPAYVGTIEISGLPTMFDTLLTFTPGGQLSTLVPAHPDGFRSVDFLQVWTGPLGTMPDWSQAQVLTCIAATHPAAGQVVKVEDTLPDPAVGTGHYYLIASMNGSDRRLGRQYMNRAFSARDPASLPACQIPIVLDHLAETRP